MQKLECTFCGGRYYVKYADLWIPPDIVSGEAFPNSCPFCGPTSYAVLVEEHCN